MEKYIKIEPINGEDGDVYIGSPAQPIKVQFDTGSSAVYFITDSCQSTSCDSSLFKKFNSKASTYFQTEMNGEKQEIRSEL